MSLQEIVDNSRTDKNTAHSYLPLYQNLLIRKKETAKNVLEIGICNGGSIKLWNDFFVNANVYGLDIMNIDDVWEGIKNSEKIILHTSTDAYNTDFFTNQFLNKNGTSSTGATTYNLAAAADWMAANLGNADLSTR